MANQESMLKKVLYKEFMPRNSRAVLALWLVPRISGASVPITLWTQSSAVLVVKTSPFPKQLGGQRGLELTMLPATSLIIVPSHLHS